MRTTGTGRAIAVMALDVAKGAAAVALAHAGAAAARRWLRPPARPRSSGTSIRSGCASTAARASRLRPACSPCWRRWRRRSRPCCSSSTVWLTRYVSLGSVAATLALPPVAWLTGAPAAVVSAAVGQRGADSLPAPRQPPAAARGTERADAAPGCRRSPLSIDEHNERMTRERRRLPCSEPAAGARRSPCTWRASGTTCGCGRATARSSHEMRAHATRTPRYLPDMRAAGRRCSPTG